MTTRTDAVSPQVYARIAGILYLIIIIAGALGQIFIRGKLIVAGDAVATAGNLMASQSLWRIGIASDLLMHVFDIPLMLALYLLLKPVNKHLARVSSPFQPDTNRCVGRQQVKSPGAIISTGKRRIPKSIGTATTASVSVSSSQVA